MKDKEKEMKKVYDIKIHSFIDVITNSSTEIFVGTHSNTVSMLKDFINNILSVAESDKTADDLFKFEMMPAAVKYKLEELDTEDIDEMHDYDDDYYGDDVLRLVPKGTAGEEKDIIDEIQRMFEIEERAC